LRAAPSGAAALAAVASLLRGPRRRGADAVRRSRGAGRRPGSDFGV